MPQQQAQQTNSQPSTPKNNIRRDDSTVLKESEIIQIHFGERMATGREAEIYRASILYNTPDESGASDDCIIRYERADFFSEKNASNSSDDDTSSEDSTFSDTSNLISNLRCYHTEQAQENNIQPYPSGIVYPFSQKLAATSISGNHFSIHHSLTTNNLPSVETGVLNIIGEFEIKPRQNESLRPGIYHILPQCHAILGSLIELVVASSKTNKDLYRCFIVDYFESIIQALSMLKEKKLCHRDLTPNNMGFRHHTNKEGQKKYRCVIFDFGITVSEANLSSNIVIGTPLYTPPETFLYHSQLSFYHTFIKKEAHLGNLGDIWAIGQVLRQLSGEHPIYLEEDCNATSEIFQKIQRDMNALSSESTEQLAQVTVINDIENAHDFDHCFKLIKKGMCEKNPLKRINLNQLQYAFQKLRQFLPHNITQETMNTYYEDLFHQSSTMKDIFAVSQVLELEKSTTEQASNQHNNATETASANKEKTYSKCCARSFWRDKERARPYLDLPTTSYQISPAHQ